MADKTYPLSPFLEYLQVEKGMSPRTVEAYERDVLDFLRSAVSFGVLDDPPASGQWTKLEGQRGLIRGHLALLRRQERRLTSLDRHLAGIRAFYRYLKITGYVEQVPDNLTLGRGGREKRLPRDLTMEMTQKLIELPDTNTPRGLRDRALMEMIYGLGLRLAEVVGLSLCDLDLSTGRVKVLGKGNRERIMPLAGQALSTLTAYLRSRLDAGVWLDLQDGTLGKDPSRWPVFEGRPGRRIARRTVQNRIAGYATELADLSGVSPHTLRHCFATHLLDGGAGIRVVQELLGHQNLATTQIYTHLNRGRLRAGFDAAFPRAKKGKN